MLIDGVLKDIRRTVSNSAMILLAGIYLIEALSGYKLAGVTAVSAAIVLIVNIPFMGRTFRLPAWIFTGAGVIGLVITKAPLPQWEYGLNVMLKTVVILIVMQTLSLSMKLGRYDEAVTVCLRKGANRKVVFYCLVMLISHLLASVLSLGSVLVILAAISPNIRNGIHDSGLFISGAISRGYSTLFLWAPGTVTVLMSMQTFSLEWQAYFIPAFTLSVIGLLLGGIIAAFRFKSEKLSVVQTTEASQLSCRSSYLKVASLILIIASIVGGISLLEKSAFSTATGRLLIVTIFVSACWLWRQRKSSRFKSVLRDYWDWKLLQNGDLSAFFLSMGLFSAAIEFSGVNTLLNTFIGSQSLTFAPFILFIIPVIVTAFSLMGLHPFVSVLMIGPIIADLSLPATNLQLGLAMSFGCCLSYMLSPFAGLILTLGAQLEEKTVNICFKANLGFSLIYYFAGVGYIWLFCG